MTGRRICRMKHLACLHCGGPIPDTRYKSSRYCSDEHAREARLTRGRARKNPAGRRAQPQPSGRTTALLACIVCGGPLPAGAAANRKTCSDTCRSLHRSRYLRDYMAALRDGETEDQRAKRLQAGLEAKRRRRARDRLEETRTFIRDRDRQ